MKRTKKLLASVMVVIMMMNMVIPLLMKSDLAAKVKKPSISPKKITLTVGDSKIIKIKNAKGIRKTKWSVKPKKAIVLSSKKKRSVKLVGKKQTQNAKVIVKFMYRGKRKTLKCSVKVKAESVINKVPVRPSVMPSQLPATIIPSIIPTQSPVVSASTLPTLPATIIPSIIPTQSPVVSASTIPTLPATISPSIIPTQSPVVSASTLPTLPATISPSIIPIESPVVSASTLPTLPATISPSIIPIESPVVSASAIPTLPATVSPSTIPIESPVVSASAIPTLPVAVSPSPSITPEPSGYQTVNLADYIPDSIDAPDTTYDSVAGVLKIRGNEIVHFELPQTLNTGAAVSVIVEGTWTETSLGWRAYLTASTGVTSNSNVATNNGSAFTGTIGESYSQSFSLATSGTSASKYLAIRGVAGPKPINLDITRIMLSFESPVISSDPQITPSVLPTSTVIASPSASPVVISSPTLMPSSEPGEFLIASNKQSVPMYLDSSGEDYEGLKLVADCFVDDIKLISDADMEIQTDLSQVENNPIIAGSIGNNDVIDRLISEEKLDVEEINGKWETYKIAIVDSPAEGVDKALVIAGSDKRGTIYGIFHVSELMGVSPWVYWADVMPEKKDYISLTDSDLSYTSKEPSVKYRGIFLNDEEPSLGTWATNFFKKSKGGKFNEYFYEHVFQLILRLKGNYMWPAMWSSAFNIEGSESTIASAELANKYGIIMGTSHHEPMMRAHQEWSRNKSKYGTAEWNYETNKEGLQQFFREGVQRNAGYENVITVGMRGDGDAPMLPEGSTVKENISLLKEIITDQKQILKDNNLEDSPTVIALYKEVEDYWYGDQDTSGLKDWDGLEDTIALLAEDNYGYLRTLPTEANKNRSGGWGMYYHFDYNGAPVSYQWIQTLQLQKIWEQMTMAYDYGAKDMWIVNVGDLKPMESAISYFMDMAWDFEQWGTTNIDSPENYTEQWVQEQFGKYTGQQGLEDLSEILSEYLKINGSRRPEKVTASTYSIDNYNEAMDMLSRVEKLIALADKYKKELPEEAQAAYYQLIYYPAVAAANINRMQIYSGLNKSYADKNLANANIYAVLLEESIQFDKELEQTYNKNMPGGIGNKWDGMMAQARNALHVGYPSWEPKGAYPKPTYIEVPESASMAVQLQGDTKVYKNGSADLQAFTNINNEMYTVNVINGGGTPFDYAAQTSHDWIKLTKTSGTVSTQDTIGVQIDFSKISADSTGTVTLIGNRRTVTINITAKVVSVSGLDPMTFVEAHDYISIEAAHYADVKEGTGNAQWKEIKNYGKTLSTLKVFPTTGGFANTEDAPYLEYKVQVNTAGNYTMQTYAVPSNNVDRDNVKKRFGVSVDGGTAAVEDFISSTYIAGTWRDSLWSNGVTNGIHTKTTDLGNLEKGVHTIRIYAMDASLALQKIVLHPTDKALKSSYFGPPESYYVGKEAITSSTVNEQKQMYVASCVIPASEDHEYEVIIPKAGSYEVAVETDSDNDLTADIYWNQNKIGQISATGSDQENILVMDEVLAAEQGKGTLSLSVTNGSSEIKKIYISQIVQEADYEKSVYTIQASSEDGQNIAENVYTHNSRLTWKPLETDTQPYLEFDFGRTVYIDRISITEKEANVNKYKLQFFDGTEWTDAYEGTFIDSGREIFLHGKTEMKGEKMRIVFTDTEAVPVISNVTLMPYINWAREDSSTVVSGWNPNNESEMNVNNSIVDGDRITKAFETGIGANTAEGKQPYQVMMEFGEKRTIDTVNVISMQEEEAAKAGTGTPPNLSQTTSRAQQTYDVYYYDGEKWISFGAVKDIPESERKVWNAISRKEAVEAEKIRVDIYTSYYIRIVELEAVQTLRPDEPEEQPAESLKDAYTPLFGKVGTAVTSQQMSDESTMNFIKSQYNSISMENEMKPSYILGSKAVVQSTLPEGYIENDKYSYMDAQYLKMNFDTIDQCIEMAYEAGLKMRFHVLVWHQQTPEWFFKEDFSTAADAEYVDAETMNGRMEYYIQNVIHHIYNTAHGKDVVYSWDVVNEYTHNYNDKKKPHWDEVYYPDDVYDESEGKNYSGRNNPCYVIDAFKLAHEQLNILESQGKIASAEAIELYYNDFNEYIPDTRTAIIDLIHNINMEAGEKICDGIGMQMHLGIGYPSVKLIGDTIDIYQEEGFKMQMTEIDITCYESDNKTTEQHTQHWSDLFTMIVSKKNSGADINCITFWGLYDSVSWRKEGVPLLFADIDTPKDSYYAVLEAAK